MADKLSAKQNPSANAVLTYAAGNQYNINNNNDNNNNNNNHVVYITIRP